MSYLRPPMGDGPITSPDQVETDDSIIVGTVKGVPRPCSEMSADSPWRRPGQPCAPETSTPLYETIGEIWDRLKGLTSPTTTAPTSTPSLEPPQVPWALVVGGAALGAYLLYKRKK